MNSDQKQSRFLSFVNKHSGVRPNELTSDCWEWTGATYGNGYGQTRASWSPDRYAHRTAYILFVGEIPEEKLIRHRCDNRNCVNPEHLVPGGKKENNQDARDRNPRACGRKLQPDDLTAIHDRWVKGELLKDIAKDYGVNWKSISRALKK